MLSQETSPVAPPPPDEALLHIPSDVDKFPTALDVHYLDGLFRWQSGMDFRSPAIHYIERQLTNKYLDTPPRVINAYNNFTPCGLTVEEGYLWSEVRGE